MPLMPILAVCSMLRHYCFRMWQISSTTSLWKKRQRNLHFSAAMLEILVWCHSSWTGCILCLHSPPQLLYRLSAAFPFLQQLLCSLMLVRSFGCFPFCPNCTPWLQVEPHSKCPALARGSDRGPSFTFRWLFPDCSFSASEFQSKLALSLWPVGQV